MQLSVLALVMMTAVVACAALGKRAGIPYPIAFVVGGLLLAFVPNVPRFHLDPNLVFLIFLVRIAGLTLSPGSVSILS